MMILLLLQATLLLSPGTIEHQPVDSFRSELHTSSSKPKDCSINLDFISEYPPYFQLYITNIISENDNLFPDNLLIAIKADEGRLLGGQSVNGWSVYSTIGAYITEKIKYLPPNCEISNNDILSFAAAYKTEDGIIDIGPESFTRKITNPICLGAGPISVPKDTLEPQDRSGNSAWTGTIHLEITQVFFCDVKYPFDDTEIKHVSADDRRRTVADIKIGLTDFDLPKQGSSAQANLQYKSGKVTVAMQENHTSEGSREKTQCHNDISGKWEWVSPGNWGFVHETKAGQATLNMKDGGLNLLIAKEMLGDKNAMQDMQKKIADIQIQMIKASNIVEYSPDLDSDSIESMYKAGAFNMDKQALEKLKGDMRNLVQGDQSSSDIPIKVSLTILTPGNRNYPISATYERKALDVCAVHNNISESRSEIIQMPLMLPVSVEMKGSYIRGKNGNDRIHANVDDQHPYHVTFGSGICPEGKVIIKGDITLTRSKN